MISTTLYSLAVVFLAEMGDKTQLLALSFAGKYKARDIMLGIFLATVLNHGLAVLVGSVAASYLKGPWFTYGVALLFVGFGVWTLFPDKDEDAKLRQGHAVVVVAVAFFLAEMGDKTQLATAGLAAAQPFPFAVLTGTTLGMLGADGLAVALGEGLYRRIPAKIVRYLAATMFFASGIWYAVR